MQKNQLFQKTIGDRLRYFRSMREMSQDDFGSLVGSDRTYISKIEKGTANIGVCKLCMICEKIGITIKDFFDSPLFDTTFYESEEHL